MHLTAKKEDEQPALHIAGTEEKVEYRDQDGNLLNEDQVNELKGKVSFKTRYETRTRLVDGAGKEVEDEGKDAPPKPEGVDPQTPNEAGEGEANTAPSQAEVGPGGDAKEASGAAPAGAIGKETVKDEL